MDRHGRKTYVSMGWWMNCVCVCVHLCVTEREPRHFFLNFLVNIVKKWAVTCLKTGYRSIIWAYLESFSREGNGTPLQYSCLENSMDGGAWWAAVRGIAELDRTERLHFHFSLSCIGEGNGNPLQCYCLENPRDRGAWWAAIYGVAQSRARLKWLSSSRIIQCSGGA